MVIAGIKNRYSQGASKNNPSIVAYPLSGILYTPGKIHKNKPVTTKKTIITR
jgi:hypothetical protein